MWSAGLDLARTSIPSAQALISGTATLQVAISSAVCALLCGFLVVWFVVGALVYRDAESRGMSGIGWFFVVFLFGLIGIIIYLVVRKDRIGYYGPPAWGYNPSNPYRYQLPPTPAAPSPTRPTPPTAEPPAGPMAGAIVGRSCPTCEANVPPGATYCPNCGTRMT